MNLPEIVDLQKVLAGHSFRLSCHSVAADPQDKAIASYLKVVRLGGTAIYRPNLICSSILSKQPVRW